MFADLAGSERQEKTGLEAGSLAAWEGAATNWDLLHFGRCIDMVVEAVSRDKKPVIIRDSTLSKVMTKPLDGHSFVTMVVCLSQSAKNGGENWFSLCFGERISKLISKVPRAETRDYENLLAETARSLEKESASLAVLEGTSVGRANRWHSMRTNMVDQLAADLNFLMKFK